MSTLQNAKLPRLLDKHLALEETANGSESFLAKVGKKLKGKKKK